MKRRISVFLMLAGLLTGCATKQLHVEPVVEPVVKDVVEQVVDAVAEPVIEQVVAPVVAPVIEESVKEIEKKLERKTVMILLKTSKGDIKLELNKEKAPKTVENFMKYVESGHYAGTIFHRVIGNFMIQGGGFTADMNQKNAPHTVENEADNGLSNDDGSVAMARTSDPHSGGAQFFINVKDNGFLNHSAKTAQGWGYCVFGKVVEGMDIVQAIKAVPTGNQSGFQDVPTAPVLINEVIVVDD